MTRHGGLPSIRSCLGGGISQEMARDVKRLTTHALLTILSRSTWHIANLFWRAPESVAACVSIHPKHITTRAAKPKPEVEEGFMAQNRAMVNRTCAPGGPPFGAPFEAQGEQGKVAPSLRSE